MDNQSGIIRIIKTMDSVSDNSEHAFALRISLERGELIRVFTIRGNRCVKRKQMSSIIGNTDFWVGSSLVVIFFWLTIKHQSIE